MTPDAGPHDRPAVRGLPFEVGNAAGYGRIPLRSLTIWRDDGRRVQGLRRSAEVRLPGRVGGAIAGGVWRGFVGERRVAASWL